MQEFEKIIALYEYTKKLVELKYSVVLDINKQRFSLPMSAIPQYENYVAISPRDYVETDDNTIASGELPPLLSVRKPDYQPCPKPPEALSSWIEDEWDNFKNDVTYISERHIDESFSASHDRVSALKTWENEREVWVRSRDISNHHQPCPAPNKLIAEWIKDGWENSRNKVEMLSVRSVAVKFFDSAERVATYEAWIATREAWIIRQRKIESVRELFMRLFNIYVDLNRESETLELMVGNGTLRIANNSQVNHPILLKRVSINLDAKDNIITIFDTDAAPEIYTLLLSSINNINHSIIKSAQENLEHEFFHPFDKNNASDFIKIFTHRLSSESEFIGCDDESSEATAGIQISMNEPVFFVRKKIDGTLKALETIIEAIKETHEYPQPLGDLVSGGIIKIPEPADEPTIEEQLAYANGENPDILLSKAANREQLEIADRIERYNAVLVQGPPGTGKTHTIANLIGHFLSQGKSVLVTSYTAKALSVIQEKLPEAIQSLCVTVSGDDNSGMVRSIDGISEFMARHTASDMKRLAEEAKAKRDNVLNQLNNIRKKLYTIRYSEFKSIVIGGQEYSPREAAEFVRLYSDELSYIPGKVELYRTLPVPFEELCQLYRYNGLVSPSEETELAANLPNPATLLSVLQFKELCEKFLYAKSETPRPETVPELAKTPDSTQIDYINDIYIRPLENIDSWAAFVAADGKCGGGYRQVWENLCALILDAFEHSKSNVNLLLGKSIQFDNTISHVMIRENIDKLTAMYEKGKPSTLGLMFNKDVKTIINGITINGLPLSSESDCKIVAAYIELERMRTEIEPLWNELLGKRGVSNFRALGSEPESIGARFVADIKTYLDWNHNHAESLRACIESTGLSYDAVFSVDRMTTEQEQFVQLFDAIKHKLPELLQSVCAWEEYNNTVKEKETILSESMAKQAAILNRLSESALSASAVCTSLKQAIEILDFSMYREHFDLLCELYEKYDAVGHRRDILDRIKSVAPYWAEEIEQRRGIHGNSVCPENIVEAWKWKQFEGIIADLTEQPYESLQRENAILSERLRDETAKLAAYRAWFHLLRNTEADLSMRQALQGWKMTVKKIGKGTGKNAPMYRRQAKEQMSLCQNAVPAWIMPINKAMDTLNPIVNKFDVIIVDEASQCDISSIGILYMAKKIIIVGDDKQVSPLSVGMDVDRINALRDMYIKEKIPNWHLYEAKTSLYDIAQTTFQPLMLREHFRCLPEIIGYSNKMSYDYKIKPLRDSGTAKLLPPVVSYRTANGMREGRKKINAEEAATIVAIIRACIDEPEYAGMTFGVITLLGDEQAALIQTQILEQIPAQIIEERKILCGNASHFQGDERDVIMLSIVDSNEGDGPLRLTGAGVDESTKQRYNVAASRAKEQLWVVHSLDYAKDLKSGDMRRDLIEYAQNPNAFLQIANAVEKHSESPFEEAVGKTLIAAGYNITQQYPVGAYRLDMVVRNGDKKVALECDGEAWHSSDQQVRSDMERQTVLERIGWRFVRIRGSEYYRNPEKTMARVMKDLEGYGILPENSIDTDSTQAESYLLERIKVRANQIMDEANNLSAVGVDDDSEQAKTLDKQYNLLSSPSLIDRTTIKPLLQTVASSVVATAEKPFLREIKACAPLLKKSPEPTILRNTTKTSTPASQSDATQQVSLFDNDLLSSLDELGIQYIDNRTTGSYLWIIDSPEKHDSIGDALKASGKVYQFEKRGSVASGNMPAWRTK